jgi:hypothetical protein
MERVDKRRSAMMKRRTKILALLLSASLLVTLSVLSACACVEEKVLELEVGFNATAECTFLEDECLGCNVTISFWAEDISSGDICPVTDVVLRLDGVPWFESGPISTGYFEDMVELEADCGQTIEIEVLAMNLDEMEATAVDSFTTPSQL